MQSASLIILHFARHVPNRFRFRSEVMNSKLGPLSTGSFALASSAFP